MRWFVATDGGVFEQPDSAVFTFWAQANGADIWMALPESQLNDEPNEDEEQRATDAREAMRVLAVS